MRFETVVKEDQSLPVIILRDTVSGCEAEIYSFGGLLNGFSISTEKGMRNVIDGFTSIADAQQNITNGFKSTKLSPFVCRMRKGSYQLDGKEYTIQKFFLGEHAIHGLVFDSIFQIKNTNADNAEASVFLEYEYKGEDAGYPFAYQLQIQWTLEINNKLTVNTTVSNTGTHSIPVADGWHPYFNLGGSVDECTLQFDSEQQYEYDSDLLPTGKKFQDNRFINGSVLKDIELDNSFALRFSLAPACVLQNKDLRLEIEPDSSYPFLQIYIPPHRNSIAIENLSGAPDNFNNKMGLIELNAGASTTFITSYTITEV